MFIGRMPGYFCPNVLFCKREQWYPTMHVNNLKLGIGAQRKKNIVSQVRLLVLINCDQHENLNNLLLLAKLLIFLLSTLYRYNECDGDHRYTRTYSCERNGEEKETKKEKEQEMRNSQIM